MLENNRAGALYDTENEKAFAQGLDPHAYSTLWMLIKRHKKLKGSREITTE